MGQMRGTHNELIPCCFMDSQPVSWHVSVNYETTYLKYKCEATDALVVKG